jgi:hypothetical protein
MRGQVRKLQKREAIKNLETARFLRHAALFESKQLEAVSSSGEQRSPVLDESIFTANR